MAINLGSTFKEFLETLNTASTDTQGVIDGTKTIKKLKLGETSDIQEIEETENFKTIKIISEKADGYYLVTGKVDEIGVNKSTGINSKLGRFSIYSRRQEKDDNGLDTINNEALIGVTDKGRISLYTADKKNFLSSQILLNKNNITFTSGDGNNKVNVDFSNANVIGLPNSGGTSDCDTNAIIDVTVLPTENINENVIYRLNIATYLFGASAGYQPFPMAKCNVVETLPTSGNPAATFDTSLNVTAIETYYEQSTNRNMGYVDETLSGIGNMPVGWYTAEQLFAVINRTYYGVIFSTSEMVDMGIYLLIEYSLYTYKNGIFKSLDIDVNKNYQWNGDNSFNGNNTFNGSVRLYGYTNFIGDPSEPSGSLAIYTNGFGIHSTETTFTKKVFFNGEVDFSNANITGLPSSGNGGLDISPAIIKYDNENNSLNIENPNGSIAFNSNEGFTMFNGDGAEIYFSDVFELYGAKAIFYDGAHINNELTIGLRGAYIVDDGSCLEIHDNSNLMLTTANEEGNSSYIDMYTDSIAYSSSTHLFYGKVDFTNATVTGLPTSGGGGSLDLNADYNWNGNHTFNNGITLNGALTLANNGEIDDTEDSLIIYKGTGSMWIGTENGGSIDINDDEMRVESYNHLTLSGNGITFGAIDGVSIYVGENDDTYFEVSPTEFNVFANNGVVNFTGNEGITFTAGQNSSTKFNGNVDFSNANVTGLPSSSNGGGLDISPAIIEYDTEQNYLNIKNPNGSINIYAEDSIYFSAEYGDIVFENPLALQNGAWFGTEGGATFDGSAKFNNEVDFTNATVIGLPSNGLTQEQVQEMINASIMGALNDEY